MNELALFAGAGGGILGGHLLGWRTVCAVEWEPYAACVLAARQNDGLLPPFPIWDDVQTFDGRPWRGIVDVVSGGFPCQDISNAGHKAGIEGERSGLWREMARIICEVRPNYVFVENVAALLGRGLGTVLADLAALGFDARWDVLGVSDCGGPQPRERVWVMAHHQSIGRRTVQQESELLPKETKGGARSSGKGRSSYAANAAGILWPPEPSLVRVADGMADRVDRIHAIGNGQSPRVAAAAWNYLNSKK
jgi:DNA (cytosine-5)-methyltransferase 1